jgi:hypothetical protein
MPDINISKNASSLIDAINQQLSFDFSNQKNNQIDEFKFDQEKLIRVISKLIKIIKYNNHHSQIIIQDIECIKEAKNIYEIYSWIKDIEENNDFVFQDTQNILDISEIENLPDETVQTLIKLSKLGVFND